MPAPYRNSAFILAFYLLVASSASFAQGDGEPMPRKDASGLHKLLEAAGYVAIPLQRVGGYYCMEARINGRGAVLILDTGAPQSHLDPKRVHDLKWDRTDGPKPIFHCTIDSLQIGPIQFGSRGMYSHDLTDSNLPGDPSLDGLIGADILEPHGAVIDYPTRTLFLKAAPINQVVKAHSNPPPPLTSDRFRVGFWNLTGRDVTLTVGSKTVTLAKNREITLDLERQFSWRIDGRSMQIGRVPDGATTHEVAIKD